MIQKRGVLNYGELNSQSVQTHTIMWIILLLSMIISQWKNSVDQKGNHSAFLSFLEESVFIFRALKKLIHNWFFCELIKKPVFISKFLQMLFTQSWGVSRIFSKKTVSCWKRLIFLKEWDRFYSFDILTHLFWFLE